jgi:hypothetical protein
VKILNLFSSHSLRGKVDFFLKKVCPIQQVTVGHLMNKEASSFS